MIELHPPENAIVDMGAPFYDVVQGGAFFIMKVPMHVGDVRSMMQPGRQRMGGGAWFTVSDAKIAKAVQDAGAESVRRARDGGNDRYSRQQTPNVSDFDIVWVHENFIRCEGKDFHFWSLGTAQILSDPREVIDAYPAHRGERPYVMGIGSIEAHNVLPMSAVESWKPLQDETNDIRNLTLDTLKQGIAPATIVRRGAQIDLRQVREHGPDQIIQASDIERDIRFMEFPKPDAGAYAMSDRINNEMSELAGNFATSDVQSNRALNETVGGMQLLSGSANSVQEFDLRVWVETWVEPVMRHMVWLEQYYESDDKLIALASKKSGAFEHFGETPDMDKLLDAQISVRVNVGIGAADPMQRLGKLHQGLQMLAEVGATGVFQGQVKAKAEYIFDEVLGLAGYRDATRFFDFTDAQEAQQNQPPDPNQMKMQVESQKLDQSAKIAQIELAMKQIELQMKQQELQLASQSQAGDMQLKSMDIQAKTQATRQDMALKQQESILKQQDMAQKAQQSQQDMHLRAMAQGHEMALASHGAGLQTHQASLAGRDQQFQQAQAVQQRQEAQAQQAQQSQQESQSGSDMTQAIAAFTKALQTMDERQTQMIGVMQMMADKIKGPQVTIRPKAGATT
jgi:hypothetical protein